jgi:ion channel
LPRARSAKGGSGFASDRALNYLRAHDLFAKPLTHGVYIDYLYFSIETLSIAGYGDMHPQTHYRHFTATVELFTGIFRCR